MQVGWVKLWRSFADTAAYRKGAVHRAIMLTLLVNAKWTTERVNGQDFECGEVQVSMRDLAKDLRLPRTAIQRAVKELGHERVTLFKNMGHQFSVICVVNPTPCEEIYNELGSRLLKKWVTGGSRLILKRENKNFSPPLYPPSQAGGESVHVEQVGTETKATTPDKVEAQANTPASQEKVEDAKPSQEPQGEEAKEAVKEKKKKNKVTYSDSFTEFWELYPRPTAKGKAYESWKSIPDKFPNVSARQIITALRKQVEAGHLTGSDGGLKYCPHPTTWLNQARWDDVVISATARQPCEIAPAAEDASAMKTINPFEQFSLPVESS